MREWHCPSTSALCLQWPSYSVEVPPTISTSGKLDRHSQLCVLLAAWLCGRVEGEGEGGEGGEGGREGGREGRGERD